MRKIYSFLLGCLIITIAATTVYYFSNSSGTPINPDAPVQSWDNEENEEGEEHDEYDGPEQRAELEFEKTKDPSLGYVPYNRLLHAIDYTENLKQSMATSSLSSLQSMISWQERGPIYDSVGPSGNGRGGPGVPFTSGRMAAILVDSLNDPSGNTVFVGGIAGGLWKCTNFLSTIPNWQKINDRFTNLAVSSICQDPTNPGVMYFSTGEATSNADAVLGAGVWKTTNAGTTWTQLPSSVNFIRNFKIMCDASGNVYLASRTTAAPALNLSGLLRSTDGGATWINIAPTLVGTATATATCTDIEISSTGKLYASFGYSTGGTTTARAYVANNPATVTQASGWILGVGVRSTATSGRLELAAIADTVYGITSNSANIADSCYKSIDGGVTWVKTNSVIMPSGIGSGQAWYDLTLAVNPANSHELLAGGLDAYKSTNDGATWTRQTYWVTTSPYVHADHHLMFWYMAGTTNRVLIACDGGIFLSNNAGTTWVDKNRNLALKQFYAGSIHPGYGSPYLLAGAQDNGVHAIRNAGLTYSHEVYGGDGCFVHINQEDPNIQFGSYVYNVYRRSINGGQTWSSVTVSSTIGLFVNPFDYDDVSNTMYGSYGLDLIMRWPNANTSNATNTLAVTGMGTATSFKVSPYTSNRVYIGTSGGRVYRLNNANTATAASVPQDFTNITGSTMPAGFINCVNVGTDDNYLIACYTNYGINNVWYSSNGGTSWTAIDGNLPDMPVRWAIFNPHDNNEIILATEAGVYQTALVNGSSTVWVPNTTFPTVRTDMLKIRMSDYTVVAATHGRGLWTGTLPSTPEVRFLTTAKTGKEATAATNACSNYTDYQVDITMSSAVNGNAIVDFSVEAGGTATEGLDFDFTTNGDFNNPSKQLTFPNGFTGAKILTIRVYDDGEIEPTEYFKIKFTLTGTSNALVGPNVYSGTILDNDRLPVPFTNANTTLGVNNTNVNAQSPFASNRAKHRMQALYYASELQAAGVNLSALLKSITLKVVTKNSTQPYNGFTIGLQNTTSASLTNFTGGTYTTVYTGNYTTVVGNNVFNFSTPFQWDGVSNIAVQICFDNGTTTPDALADLVEGNSQALGAAGLRGTCYSSYTTGTGTGCTIAAAFISDVRMNATFSLSFGDPVATALNSTKTQKLGGNKDVYYFSNTGDIVARMLTLSDHNYGCTEIQIDRAGTGAKQFWNTNPENYLMDKTYRILPATNNPTGKYEVTFYFTKEEKEGWEAATGQTWDKIQIIKLPSRISNVTPANAQPDGPGTIQVIDAVKREFGTGFTLSAIFNNGFSGFGFGVAGRMNTILNLTGAINSNNVDIDLHWTTSAEINSSIFEVEKSYDGITFTKIGYVQAAGNKLIPSGYDFVDHENSQENYYRIKMLHTDGYILYSNTVYIKKGDAPQKVLLYPNPFVANLTIRFGRLPVQPVVFSFYDMTGKLVRRYTEPAGAPVYNINTTGILSRANYLLKVNVDGEVFTKQVMKR